MNARTSAFRLLGLHNLFHLSVVAALALAGLPARVAPAQAASTTLVINEIDYDQPGTDAAEFLELKNVSGASINLDLYTVELVNGTGGGASVYQTIDLPNVDLAAGDYYVVCANAANTANCDLDVSPETNLIQNGAPDAVGLRLSGALVDAVSYEGNSGAPYTEGSGTGLDDDAAEANESISRCPDGSDTDQNNVDLVLRLMTPGAANDCPPTGGVLVINEIDYDQAGTDAAEFIELKNVGTGAANLDNFTVELVNGSGGGAVLYQTIDLPNVDLAAGDYYVVCANATNTANCDLDVSPETNLIQNGAPDAVGLRLSGALVDAVSYEGDTGAPYTEGSGSGLEDNPDAGLLSIGRCPDGADTTQNNVDFAFDDITPGASNNCPPPGIVLTIMQIQDSAHLSPYLGQTAADVPGIVTAVRSNGFFMQDAAGDGNIATSDGIFVFTSSAPTVSVGDAVLVGGTVAEFRPGGVAGINNLTTSEITSPIIVVTSTGNPLPAPVVIGNGGRVPPDTVIDDDATGDVETSGAFDPATDGIDFYESLEGMRVQVNDAVVVGPRNDFGEIWVLGDDGANAAVRTTRGGIVIRPTDFNPERIQLDDAILTTPSVDVGDHFTGPVVGVIDYSFGNFEVLITSPLTADPGGLDQETTAAALPGQLAVATFNVENLDPGDSADKFDDLADLIVNHLRSPDLIALEEVQDNNGPTNDSVVDASLTYAALIDAIVAAGGPTYDFRNINPVDDQDGGEPGGNIRVGFLFRDDRGLAFVDRAGGTSTAATTVLPGPQLSFSPGRIDPTNPAFATSRKPLAGEFTYYGQTLFVIANHFNSKGGDQPLFGHFQPPTRSTEVQRNQQAQVVNDFVDALLAEDSNADVIVLGDLNDFEFSTALATVRGGVLHNLIETLPQAERYTYDFEGNSQTLDHLLVSDNLFNTVAFDYDVVHVNAEFAEQASDHDPQVGLFCLDQTGPALSVTVSPNTLWPPNHKYVTVNATVTVTDNADPGATFTLVSVTSNEPDNGEDDGDTVNDIVIVDSDTFKLRAERSGTGTGRIYTITYQATDACGNVTVASATVTVPLSQGE